MVREGGVRVRHQRIRVEPTDFITATKYVRKKPFIPHRFPSLVYTVTSAKHRVGWGLL